MSLVNTKIRPQALKASPPARKPARSAKTAESVDSFQPSSTQDKPITYKASWASARTNKNKAKLSGFQIGAIALGTVAAFAGIIGGFAGTVPSSAPTPAPETAVETQTEIEQTSEIELAVEVSETEAVQEEAPTFSDGRELLIDRSARVHSQQFQPDPSEAIEQGSKFTVYGESYIRDLVDRDVTEVPDGAPSFTAHGVDAGQSSKIYHDADLNEAQWGYGSIRTGDFFTRPDRMRAGRGIRDQITQHQLSAVYRLEAPVTMDGVRLEPGLYRVLALSPSSGVATPQMHRAVAPGHRLVSTGSGVANDYKPLQTAENGEALRINPDDIVQVWTLTPAEQADFGQ